MTTTEWIAATPLETEDVQNWLAEKVAGHLGIEADEVDADTPFSDYGLQSAQAMAIAAAGRTRFGLEISPLVIWNCPTIASLSAYVVQSLNQTERESFEI